MNGETLWERVDEPVLRWVATLPPVMEFALVQLEIREPVEEIDGLDSRTVNESLRRLQSHHLIDGEEHQTTHHSTWSKLRLTALGLIVLGEWPDLDRVASAVALRRLLLGAAEEAPDSEKAGLRRAAGAIARVSDDVLRDVITEVAGSAGEDLR
jgi:hypothetical protein